MNATEAKRRVLAVYPAAFAAQVGQWCYVYSRVHIENIGKGPTKDEAWIAAAAGLEERNER